MTPIIVVTVAAPVETVWDALRDPKKIRHWHGWDFEENGGLDAEIDLIYQQNFTADEAGHVLNVQGGDVFRLEPDGDGCRVTLTRAPHSDDPEWDQYYDDVTEGWITFMHQLKFAVERHPGEERRTVFLSGSSVPGGVPIDLAGAEGSPYRAELAGQQVHGTVWFRSEHQLGLTVDEWRDGLVVLSQVGPSETKPDGAAMAVLSTYGLDDASYDALSARWTGWWQSVNRG
jgi:uncharacterized protein YndB with AHSA1/START domain